MLPPTMAANATLILRLLSLTGLLVLATVALTVSVQLAKMADGVPPLYVLMGLTIASFSVLVLVPVFALQVFRPVCAPFVVWFEILWTTVLGGAWFALAVKMSLLQDKDNSLSSYADNPALAARYTALQDAVFLSWAFLWSWALWLGVLALRAWRRGTAGVWGCPTRCAKFLELKPPPADGQLAEKTFRSSSTLPHP